MSATLNGTSLFYALQGHGAPMLVMHGGLGLDHTYLRPSLDPLAERVELIYFDHRGNGRSPAPEDWDEVDHSSWVRDADDLREALGHDRIVLFGHSYGSFLAQEYALRYPERIAGLILCSTAPVLDYPDIVIANARARGTPEIVDAVLAAFSSPAAADEDFQRLWLEILPLYFHCYEAESARRLFAETRFRAAAYNRATFHCAAAFDTLKRLNSISAPTLVLSGRHDWIMPPEQGGGRVAERIPGARHVVFDGSGHFPFVEERERFLSTVSEWLGTLAL